MRNMRVLLDEQLDVALKALFDDDLDVVTVRERRWNGMKNGELLRAAQEEFDVLVSMDKNLEHQQNVSTVEMGIVVIRAKSNVFEDVAPSIPKVNETLRTIQPGELVYVSV